MKLFVDRVPTRPKDCLFAIHPSNGDKNIPLNCLIICNYNNIADAFSQFTVPASSRSCTLETGIPCPFLRRMR